MFRALHFNKQSLEKNQRLSFLIANLNNKFLVFDISNLAKYLAIDESIIKFEGRFSELRYCPGKSNDRGIKLFKLARPSGYVIKIILDLGAKTIYGEGIPEEFENI